MRHLVIADIHSNLAAFQAVLSDACRQGGFDSIWCLGDTVGYGPDPHACIKLLRRHKHVCVAGNHDLAAVGKLDTGNFNYEAAQANQWTARQLTPEDVAYLKSLPLQLEQGLFTMVHGSPRQPIWEYLIRLHEAMANFGNFRTPYCLIGHSHVALLFEQVDENHCTGHRLSSEEHITLGRHRLIINPGSVGQPRDGDPRAAYAIYDEKSQTVMCYRVEYNIVATQAKMLTAKLPQPLIDRLEEGW
ncbi:MAG: metallophosphoesterase family protein [Chloroflexota bacterium]